MMNVTLVNNAEGDGDWEGLYIDGMLIDEGHSLSLYAVLEELANRKAPITSLLKICLGDQQMETLGNSCPFSLDEVVTVLHGD